jgi:hypothetical protein
MGERSGPGGSWMGGTAVRTRPGCPCPTWKSRPLEVEPLGAWQRGLGLDGPPGQPAPCSRDDDCGSEPLRVTTPSRTGEPGRGPRDPRRAPPRTAGTAGEHSRPPGEAPNPARRPVSASGRGRPSPRRRTSAPPARSAGPAASQEGGGSPQNQVLARCGVLSSQAGAILSIAGFQPHTATPGGQERRRRAPGCPQKTASWLAATPC